MDQITNFVEKWQPSGQFQRRDAMVTIAAATATVAAAGTLYSLVQKVCNSTEKFPARDYATDLTMFLFILVT